MSFDQLQRPLIAAFEDIANTAVKYSDVEQEATSLRAVIGERDADFAAANARAVDAERRVAEALAQIEQQRGQLAELARERDDASGLQEMLAERAATLGQEREVAQAEVAILREALARTERAGQESAAASDAMRAEIGSLRAALTQAEREGLARGSAAEAMQEEVEALRDTLARTERRAQQRAAASQALEIAFVGLRAKWAKAEHESRESAAAAKAMYAEIMALRGTLNATRRIGQAAIAAFRIDNKTPVELDGPRGWRQPIARFFDIGLASKWRERNGAGE